MNNTVGKMNDGLRCIWPAVVDWLTLEDQITFRSLCKHFRDEVIVCHTHVEGMWHIYDRLKYLRENKCYRLKSILLSGTVVCNSVIHNLSRMEGLELLYFYGCLFMLSFPVTSLGLAGKAIIADDCGCSSGLETALDIKDSSYFQYYFRYCGDVGHILVIPGRKFS